jgi:hypothetical protein
MEPWKIGGHFGRDLKRTKEEMMERKKRWMRKRYHVCGSEETFSSRPKGRCHAIPWNDSNVCRSEEIFSSRPEGLFCTIP